jgi:hypothetical protein
MPDDKSTTARERILQHWERSISDALSSGDRDALRFLQASIADTVQTLAGNARARARAALARCMAARRFLRGGRRHGR